MPLPKITPWKQGDPFSAKHLNESVDLLGALFPLTGDGVDQVTGRGGTSVSKLDRLKQRIRPVRVTEADTRTGIYKGQVYGGRMNSVRSGNLRNVDLGALGDGHKCFLWSVADVEFGDRTVAVPSNGVAYFSGEIDQGKPVGIILSSSAGVAFGKATADWGGSNTITLTPVKSLTDATANGLPNVTAYIVTPTGKAPENVDLLANEIVAYIPQPGNKGLIVNVKQGAGGGDDLGVGQPYQVHQTNAAGSAIINDWVRAH
jgi:hypothetical protein